MARAIRSDATDATTDPLAIASLDTFFFGYNVLNTQATEHRGASPPPNEGFVQHAARDT